METLQRTANRGSISTASYDIDNSIKFETANTESLTKSQTASNRKTWTLSFWFKRTKVDADLQYTFQANVNSSTVFDIVLNGITDWRISDYASGSRSLAFYSTVPLRDASAWYHLVVACDTTQGTEANRFKVYLNGVDVTAISGYFSTASYPAEDYETNINNSAATLSIGKSISASTNFCGYIAEVNFIDGLMKDEEDFGKFDSASGIWQPIEYTGSYGNEGYYLDFADSGDLGDDESGNGKDFTENNITAADQATDTPTNNFCTFNAVNMYGNTATLKEGATFTASTANGAFTTYGTMAPSSGKWWWEGKIQVFESGSTYACIGATTNLAGLPSVSAQLSGGHVIKLAKAQKWVLNDTGYSYGAAYADGDIINVGLDLDNRKFYSYKNGTIDDANGIDISSTTFDGFGSQWMPLVITYGSGGASSYEINFGGYRTYGIGSAASDANGYGTFEYAPASGFYALCSQNLALYG